MSTYLFLLHNDRIIFWIRYATSKCETIDASSIPSVSISIIDHLKAPSAIQLSKNLAYEEWTRKKKCEALCRKKETENHEAKNQAKAKRLIREKEDRERREEENFQAWTEKKKQEEERKRIIALKRLELEKELKEIQEKAYVTKQLYLRQWALKKEKEQKVQKEEEKIKLNQIEEEKMKRMENSTRAFNKWREKSKNKMKPATQGLLPHQKAIPAYINPNPWNADVTMLDMEKRHQSNRKTMASLKPKTY